MAKNMDLNVASAQDLERIQGIGKDQAKRFIDFRTQNGAFKSWEDAAVDALANCAPHAAKWKDWTAGGTFTLLEEYNGLGYAALGRPSPYVWASTDQYIRGKYIADGHYDPHAIDHQLGCAALLNRMAQMDPTIRFVDTDEIGHQLQSEAA